MQRLAVDDDNRTEIEIIANAALLIVDYRVLYYLCVLDGVVIAIQQCGIGVFCHFHKTFNGIHTERYGCAFHVPKHIVGRGVCRDTLYGV